MSKRISQKAMTIANAAREAARFNAEAVKLEGSLISYVEKASRKQLCDAAADLKAEYDGLIEVFQSDNSVLPHKRKNGETVTDKAGNPQPVTFSQFPPFETLTRTVRKASAWEGLKLSMKKGVATVEARGKNRGKEGSNGSASGQGKAKTNKDTFAGIVASTVQRVRAINKNANDSTVKRRVCDAAVSIAVEGGGGIEGLRNAINRYLDAERKAKAGELADNPDNERETANV